MGFTLTIGWWIVPALASVAALHWFGKQDYSGDYNFTAVFTAPATALMICFSWMVYFGLGWALS